VWEISGSAKIGVFFICSGGVVEQTPWAKLGHKDLPLALVSDPLRGGLWLGFFEGGVTYFKDGQVRASYTSTEGLGAGHVEGFQLERDGTLWAETQGGLSRVKYRGVATLTTGNGLPCNTVHWMMEDDANSFWLYTACGVVRIARPELDTWATDSKLPGQLLSANLQTFLALSRNVESITTSL
jgi:ligand-binding sensor domain-containing protein